MSHRFLFYFSRLLGKVDDRANFFVIFNIFLESFLYPNACE